MFDWEKYNAEHKKRNNKVIWALFGLWLVFTVCFGLVLREAELSSNPTLTYILGGVAYAISIFIFVKGGFWWQLREQNALLRKLEKEVTTEFLNEKGLAEEFNEYANAKVIEVKK